ncbi:MAG: B12-binding domain-containing radical SAM protein [Candidatus Omnitrophica bacterium]|nr:B12-binding domain-containing radical SAM protein [Candidatus Omnitrophota bacterium]
MRFLMIYPNQWATGNKPIGIASLAAVLKQAGHEFRLFDFTQYDLSGGMDDRGLGEVSLEFRQLRNPERLPPRRRVSRQEALDDLLKMIDETSPDMIGLSVLSDDYPFGLQALRSVRQHFRIPTIVGGVHATVDPDGVLREPCVDMVCLGEGEEVLAEVAARVDRGEDLSTVENLWIKTLNGEMIRNHVRPLRQDLDTLPYPDWTIYPDSAFYKPFDGHVYKYGDFEMSRGCPFTCSYCINVELQQIYKGKGNYHREKSVARVIQEIAWFTRHYGIEFIKFWDETFLLMSDERLERLATEYSRTIGIPFAIETISSSVTPRTAKLLKQFGCATASLGLETGNVDLRRGVLDKNIDTAAYEQAYQLLREQGIRGVSFNMIGLPFERRADIFETIRLNVRLKTEAQAVGIFYPYKGTPIRTFCESNGLLDTEFEASLLAQPTEHFMTYTKNVGSVLKLADLTRKELVRLRDFFSYYVVAPEWLWPLIDECGTDRLLSSRLTSIIFRCLYWKKFGEAMDQQTPDDSCHADAIREPVSTHELEQRRGALPVWMRPFLAACETDPTFAEAFVPRIWQLWQLRDVALEEGPAAVDASPGVPVLTGAHEFNQGGRLDSARLNEIRTMMRALAKQDISTQFAQADQSDCEKRG